MSFATAATIPDGFRGIKWGESIKNISGLMQGEKQGRMIGYVRKNDKMFIGNAKLTSIRYTFYNDKFCGVVIITKGPLNFQGVVDTFTEAYGDPKNIPVNTEYDINYYWALSYIPNSGGIEESDVTIVATYSKGNEIGQIAYLNVKKVLEEEKREEEERRKKSKKGIEDL
jgi:hypothetical protein